MRRLRDGAALRREAVPLRRPGTGPRLGATRRRWMRDGPPAGALAAPPPRPLPPLPYTMCTHTHYIHLPRDGHGQFQKLTLLAALTLANGAASGTKSAHPPSTLAAIKRMWLEVTPAPEGGSRIEISPTLWHK